jgi:hypothetical protein
MFATCRHASTKRAPSERSRLPMSGRFPIRQEKREPARCRGPHHGGKQRRLPESLASTHGGFDLRFSGRGSRDDAEKAISMPKLSKLVNVARVGPSTDAECRPANGSISSELSHIEEGGSNPSERAHSQTGHSRDARFASGRSFCNLMQVQAAFATSVPVWSLTSHSM